MAVSKGEVNSKISEILVKERVSGVRFALILVSFSGNWEQITPVLNSSQKHQDSHLSDSCYNIYINILFGHFSGHELFGFLVVLTHDHEILRLNQ